MIKEQKIRREAGWLVLGVVLGILGGIISDLWAAYYVKWLETTFPHTDWRIILILSTIALVIVIAWLLLWAISRIREG